ncbi:MAG TPA: short-chain dehydrogenase, partial [Cytophagales bacterium]|nr:short-chain dehydrogenase [Cytophagales bacterium]
MGNQPSIFITGGARGIGLSIGKLFLEQGWKVGLYDIDAAELEKVRQELANENLLTGTLDVTNSDSAQVTLQQFAEATGGRLDVLVNNAGMVRVGEFEATPLADYQQMVTLNLAGPITMTYQALPWLKTTPNSRIVNVSSASAIYGNPELTVYAATKVAVRNLTEGWRLGFAKFGIHATAILPIYTRTRMVDDYVHLYQGLKLKDVTLTAEDVARVCWKAAT